MKELETKPHIFEGIDDETGDYTKSEGQKVQYYKFCAMPVRSATIIIQKLGSKEVNPK